MDYSEKLALSYYKNIATINEAHKIFLVQHQDTHKIFVKKILTVYNINIYRTLLEYPICGIPKIVDYYESDNQLTLIENYVSGQSLEEIMSTYSLDLETILHYFLELCSILRKLHSMQPPIVHRDIKPSNIIITEHNHVVLIDFNAAKFFSDSSTTDTVLLGTKGYAAPEQYGFGTSSPKTDIYAFGILLKELTSSLPNVPINIMKIIDKCTQIDPSERYNTVDELEYALRNINQTQQTYQPYQPAIKLPLSYNELLLPGFRTHTPWKMLVAIPSYILIFWLSLSVNVENTYGLALWITRLIMLFMFLSIVFGTFNYLNIHDYFPLCKSKHRIKRYLGIASLDIMLVAILFLILLIFISIIAPA